MPKPWKPDEIVDVDISPCELYRYLLSVRWSQGKTLAVVGLNPSTADKKLDDKTVRVCIKWARGRNYGGLVMLNAYAFRDTKPKKMMDAEDPFGEQTPEKLVELCGNHFVIAAWGGGAKHLGRGAAVAAAFAKAGVQLECWGINEVDDSPKHPSRIPLGDTEPWPRLK